MTRNRFENIEWRWWTSNSWRRLTEHNKRTGEHCQDGNVLCPTKASDGHPDIIALPENMAAIEAVPELYSALMAARNALRGHEDGVASRELAGAIADMADAALAKADRRTI